MENLLRNLDCQSRIIKINSESETIIKINEKYLYNIAIIMKRKKRNKNHKYWNSIFC